MPGVQITDNLATLGGLSEAPEPLKRSETVESPLKNFFLFRNHSRKILTFCYWGFRDPQTCAVAQ